MSWTSLRLREDPISKRLVGTIKEWERITGIQILDPDGFNRQDKHLHERLFTYTEFEKGMMRSTIIAPKYEEVMPVGILAEIPNGN